MQLVGRDDVALERRHQRIEQRSNAAHHTGECRALELDALARVNLALPVQRQVIRELADHHMGKQARSCQAACNRTARCRSLSDRLALRARVLRAHMADHLEARRNDLEHLRHVLAEQAEHAAAASTSTALGVLRLVNERLARQVIGQRLARRAPVRRFVRRGLCRARSLFLVERFALALELFDEQLELLQLSESLGAGAELLAPVAGELELEFFDHEARLEELGFAANDQSLQSIGVIGQRRRTHARFACRLHAGTNPFSDHHLGLPGTRRSSPVDAFQKHGQLCRRQRHAARRCLRPDEAAALEPLGEQH